MIEKHLIAKFLLKAHHSSENENCFPLSLIPFTENVMMMMIKGNSIHHVTAT
jgi:hypothetical protein